MHINLCIQATAEYNWRSFCFTVITKRNYFITSHPNMFQQITLLPPPLHAAAMHGLVIGEKQHVVDDTLQFTTAVAAAELAAAESRIHSKFTTRSRQNWIDLLWPTICRIKGRSQKPQAPRPLYECSCSWIHLAISTAPELPFGILWEKLSSSVQLWCCWNCITCRLIDAAVS